MLFKFADNRNPKSLASRMRARRHEMFRSLLDGLPRPLRILDVGGTKTVWETMGLTERPDVQITILNLAREKSHYSNVRSTIGDARDMRHFSDGQFDVVYSNSVIEHVGAGEHMIRMASEIRRVGKRYFVQTPNRYFPIEPHFVFPMFQFLPIPLRVLLVQNFSLGWISRESDRRRAEEAVRSVNLLSRRELQVLFPDGTMVQERLFGLTKSLLVTTLTEAN
jgi:SAM-dependent methyltransferase